MKTRFYYITAILSMLMMALTTKAQEAEYEYVPVVREGVEWGYVASYHFPPGAEFRAERCRRENCVQVGGV